MTQASSLQPFTHDAFISYSRKDRAFASKLESTLERYVPPRQLSAPHKHLDIFRDESDFTGVEYHASVGKHLQSSAKLIVICSPNARNSPYVDEEIRLFAERHAADQIIPVLLSGRPNNEATTEVEKAFPDALCELLNMPLAIDYREVDLRHTRLDRGRLFNAWYTLLANLYDVPRAQIEMREELRRRRRRWTIAATTVAINLVVLALAAVAIWQRHLAIESLFDANQNLAEVFEEKARTQVAKVLQTGDQESAQQVWLYALSALALPKRPEPGVPTSVGRLLLPEVRDQAFSKIWSVQRTPDGFNAVALSPDGELLAVAAEKDILLFDIRRERSIARLSGHYSTVRDLAFSPDGTTLASCSGQVTLGLFDSDNSIRLWDIAERRQLFRLDGHKGQVNSVAFRRDGRVLASGSDDGTVRLWQTSSGAALGKLAGHASPVQSVIFVPENEMLISASGDRLNPGADNAILVWNPKTQQQIGRLVFQSAPKYKHYNPMLAVAASRDGKWIAAGGADSVIRVWETSSLELAASLEGHRGSISALSFSPSGDLLVSGSRVTTGLSGGGGIRLWDIASGKQVTKLEGHIDTVSGLAFSDDGSTLASVSSDSDLRLWSIHSRKVQSRLEGFPEAVLGRRIAFSTDGKLLLSGMEDGTVRVLDVNDGRELWRARGDGSAIKHVVFEPDSHRFVTTTSLLLTRWDFDARKVLETRSAQQGEVDCIAASPNGDMLAIGYDPAPDDSSVGGQLLVLGGASRGLRAKSTHATKVTSVAFSPDSELIATGAADGTVSLWNASDGSLVHSRKNHARPVSAVAFSPDGKTLASTAGQAIGGSLQIESAIDKALGADSFDSLDLDELARGYDELSNDISAASANPNASVDYAVRLWRLPDLEESDRLVGHTSPVNRVDFSPDGAMLATASSDGTARIWSLRDNTQVSVTRHKSDHVQDVVFHPSGEFFATSSDVPQLWKSPSRARYMLPHDDTVSAVAVSPENGLVASGAADNRIRIWRDSNFVLEQELVGHEGEITALAFSQDGQFLASGSADATVRLWDMNRRQQIARFDNQFPIKSLAINASGSLLAVSHQDPASLARSNGIHLWSVEQQREIGVLEGHKNTVTALAFHPVEDRLASTSVDHSIRIWDVATGLSEFLVEEHSIGRAAAFSSDGSRLLVGGGSWIGTEDSFVSIWDFASHDLLATFTGHTDIVWTVRFGRDRNQVVSGSEDNTIRVWDIEKRKETLRIETKSPIVAMEIAAQGQYLLVNDASSLRIIHLAPTSYYMGNGDAPKPVSTLQAASFAASEFTLNGVNLAPRARPAFKLSVPQALEKPQICRPTDLAKHRPGLEERLLHPVGAAECDSGVAPDGKDQVGNLSLSQ